MAGTSIPFFPRQTLVVQAGGANTLYYSEPFDITPYENMTVSFQVFGLIGTNPQVDLEIQMDDRIVTSMEDWGEAFTAVTAAPTQERKTVSSGLARFARAEVTVSGNASDVAATVEVIGTAREGS